MVLNAVCLCVSVCECVCVGGSGRVPWAHSCINISSGVVRFSILHFCSRCSDFIILLLGKCFIYISVISAGMYYTLLFRYIAIPCSEN